MVFTCNYTHFASTITCAAEGEGLQIPDFSVSEEMGWLKVGR